MQNKYKIILYSTLVFIFVLSPAYLVFRNRNRIKDFSDQNIVPTPSITSVPEKVGGPDKSVIYSCPINGWVNCMPILTEEAQQACTKEAQNWYKANCPDYEGVAY